MPLDVIEIVSCHCLCPVMHPIRRFTCNGGEPQLHRMSRMILEEFGEPLCVGCYKAIAMQEDPLHWMDWDRCEVSPR